MKRLITSFALTMLVMLGASGIASAQTNYTCANVPASISGYAVIGTATTACSITKAITANASIEILGTTISTEAVTDTDGNILMISQGSLTASGTITGAADFNIDLKANQGGGNANLTIGSGGISKIVAMSGTSIVYVTNGTASSTGTLTLSADSDISVPDGSNDYIILNAQGGTLSIPTGTLSSTGSSGPAGQIQLLAATVNFANNAILTTAQTSSGYSNHGVVISAATINYGGTSSGLEMIGDGNGGFSYLLPQGATTIADSGNYQNLTIVVTNTQTLQNPLSVVGASGAPFEMTANNSTVGIHVVAYPISFTGGAVTLQANAPGGDYIEVFNPGTLSGKTGLTFGGTGTVLIDASGNGGAGGYLYISADQTVVSAPTLTLNASGPSSGSGNGGTLYFQTTKTTLSGATVSILNNGSATGTGNAGSYTQFYSSGAVQMPTTTFTMSANGSSGGAGNGGPVYFQGSSTTVPAGLKSTITANGGGSGTGSGGTITMYPVSNITLGNNAGQFAVSATSGSTGGNGGSISIEPFSSTLTVNNTATPISVAVLGATGNGGSITLQASTITFNGTSSQLTGNGGSTSGNGGSITLNASTTALTIGTGSSGNVQLYAKAPGNGNGGSISVTDYTGITVNSADLSVLAGTTGNGNGGSIAFTGGPATLTGSFSANGSGNGNGGTSNFQNGYFTFNGTQSFTANSLGTGQGGTITFNSTYSGQSSPLTLGVNTTLQANSTSGAGGTINITAASQPIAVTGAGVTVTAGGNGAGGTIGVTASANTITVTGNLVAEGAGTGNGGYVKLSGTTVNLGTGTIDVGSPSGSFTNSDNNITITSVNSLTLQSPLRAVAGESPSKSGNILVSSGGDLLIQSVISAYNSQSNGTGGNITITAGSASANGKITVSAQVTASALTAGGTAGTVKLNYADSTGTNPVLITAQVQADQPAGVGTNGVTITNQQTQNVDVSVTGLLSANNNLVTIITPGSSDFDATVQGDGQITGAIKVTNASNVDINMGLGSVTIDNIVASAGATITTADTYAILSDGIGSISSPVVTLSSGGNVGDLTGQDLKTSASTLTVSANTSTSTTQNVAISNSGGALTLNSSTASGTFSLTTNSTLTLNSVTAALNTAHTTNPGNIDIFANGAITIENNSGIQSYGGSVTITTGSGATITVGADAAILANGYNNTSFPGLVELAVGTPTGLVPFTGMTNFQLTTGSLNPQVSGATPPFTANAPTSHATVLNSNMILYGPLSNSITFNGGNQVTAITPN